MKALSAASIYIINPFMVNEFGQNVISFVAHNAARVEVHRHHCFQIVAAIKGDFGCTIGGNSYSRRKGFIVNQNITHSCQAENASVIVYFIDAESYHGWQLKELLAGEKFLDIEQFFSESELNRFCAEGNQDLPKAKLKNLADEVFHCVLPENVSLNENLTDERIVKTLDFIDANLSESIRLEQIADLIFLSPERTRHLFAQQTGSPFSQYVLWKRIKQVIISVLQNEQTLTEAALEFGFADQAHFCRIFKRMFGMSPKTHLKNSRFVQFLNPFV